MKQKRLLIVLFIVLTVLSLTLASLALAQPLSTETAVKTQKVQAQDSDISDSDEEKAKATLHEQANSPQPTIQANSGGNIGELFVGVDDVAIDAYTIDVTTNDFYTAFNGVQVWGAAYDPVGDRVYFNSGSVLWEWPVGGTPTSLGTMTIGGAAASMVGLAHYNGTLYASRNIGTEDIYAVDTTTLAATVAITLTPPTASRDLGGIDIDPATGQLYGTNDAAALRGLVEIDPDGTVTVIAPYPTGQTDIDGLAVGGGNAYLVTDEPGFVYVFNLTTMTYTTPLVNPWTTSELFSAGAWLGSAAAGPNINLAKTVGTDPSICAASDNIDVEFGTTVAYCYEVTNTGDVTFTLHDLDDSELGPILSGFNFSLAPGASAFLTQTAVITQTTVNTATWTAYNPGPTDVVSDTDSATVTIFFAPQIEANPGDLASTQAPETQVNQTLTISNVGTGDLDWSITAGTVNVSSAPQLAAVNNGSQPVVQPEVVDSPEQCAAYENYAGAEPAGYAQYCVIHEPQSWLSASLDPTATAFAQDIGFISDNFVSHVLNDFPGQTVIGPNTRPIFAMDFDETGTTLYAIDNTTRELGTYNLTSGAFTVITTVSGIPLADNISGLTIDPVTGTAYVSGLGTGMTLYTMDLTTGAATVIGSDPTVTLLIDIAIGPQGIIYGHDIGTDSIYTIDKNTGVATLVGSTGVDSNFAQGMDFDNTDGKLYAYTYQGGGGNQYGIIDLGTGALTPLAIDNPLGEFEGATMTIYPCLGDLAWVNVTPDSGTTGAGDATDVTVTFDSTGLGTGVYTGTLCINSNDASNPLVTVPLTLTVEAPAPAITLEKTVGTDSSCAVTDTITVTVGTDVTYCYTVTNTGNVTLDLHDLDDSELGSLLSSFAYDLNPGESVFITETATATISTVNTATWTASSSALSGVSAMATDTATVVTLESEPTMFYIYLPFVARDA